MISRILWSRLVGAVVVSSVLFGACVGWFGQPAGAASPPSVSLTAGPYVSGQKIKVSVGPNKYFKPYLRIIMIECADPKGSPGRLPTGDASCDGNTAPGFSVLVNKDGSFSTSGYQVFALPNTVLGEAPDGRPVCNRSKPCVLYVGQNQNNFTAPKVFSRPFTISTPHSTAKKKGA